MINQETLDLIKKFKNLPHWAKPSLVKILQKLASGGETYLISKETVEEDGTIEYSRSTKEGYYKMVSLVNFKGTIYEEIIDGKTGRVLHQEEDKGDLLDGRALLSNVTEIWCCFPHLKEILKETQIKIPSENRVKISEEGVVRLQEFQRLKVCELLEHIS